MALENILGAVPDWFRVTDMSTAELLGRACIELENAAGVIEAELRVRDREGVITVQEQVPGTRYPKTCHERHLQSDEHFCIGMNAGRGIISRDHAVVWWAMLKHFLKLQRVAERTKRWPPRQEIAHGSAGPHQLGAIAAAKELGIEDQYMQMLAGNPTWFATQALKINSRGKLKHAWLACPVGCRKNGKPVARSSCCRPDAVITLLTEERLRRKKMAEFYAINRESGEKCCGTMLNCPLRDKEIYISLPTRSNTLG